MYEIYLALCLGYAKCSINANCYYSDDGLDLQLSEDELLVYSRRFNLSTTDILSQIPFVVGLCVVGCSARSLASPHQMPAALPHHHHLLKL